MTDLFSYRQKEIFLIFSDYTDIFATFQGRDRFFPAECEDATSLEKTMRKSTSRDGLPYPIITHKEWGQQADFLLFRLKASKK